MVQEGEGQREVYSQISGMQTDKQVCKNHIREQSYDNRAVIPIPEILFLTLSDSSFSTSFLILLNMKGFRIMCKRDSWSEIKGRGKKEQLLHQKRKLYSVYDKLSP